MTQKLRDNSLSLVTLVLFFMFLLAQSITGHRQHNHDREDHGDTGLTYGQYLTSGHFLEATMENWESEFLQMGGGIL